IVQAVDALAQGDVRERIVAGEAALRADGVFAVEVSRGLSFAERVGARPQVLELIGAIGIRRSGLADGAEIVAAAERDRRAADAGFTRVLAAVVVDIGENEAGERRRREFAEVIVLAIGARSKRDAAHLVVGQRAALRTDRILAVEISRGLGFLDAVSAGHE